MRACTSANGARPRSSTSGSKSADYRPVALAVSFVCAFALQQLVVTPYPAEVGTTVTVTARNAAGPLVGVTVQVELPDGTRQPLGPTDERGSRTFEPPCTGQFLYSAVVDGVRVLSPHRVVAVRPRWWLAAGSVPLGLALLWRLSRARGRRDP